MKLIVVKTENGLLPYCNSDEETYAKIPLKETFEIEYKKPRNYKFHKKYFALLKLAFDNQTRYRDFKSLRRDMIITAGFYTDQTNMITGEIYPVADSISFAKMDGVQFEDLYEKTKDVISTWLGIENRTIDEEIQQYY